MPKKLALRVLLAFAVAAATAADAVYALEQATQSETQSRLKSMQGKEFETSFLRQMIHHHRSGIAMAKLI